MGSTPPSRRILIVYYSRTGTTHHAAEELRGLLGTLAELEELHDDVRRVGPIGYMRCGREALRRHTPPIHPLSHDPAEFELVVVGTPVWAATMAGPVRTFLTQHGQSLRGLVGLCTAHIRRYRDVFTEMQELAGIHCEDGLELSTRQIRRKTHRQDLEKFAQRLQRLLEDEALPGQPAARNP